jgi:hypothetical protein
MPTEVTLHHDHSLIRVQYRPLSAPTIDGSELALLKRFRTVTTEEDFYLYFPFLFSDFGGFREVRDVNIAKILAMLDSSPNWNPETIKQTREMLEQSSVDSFTRTFGRGDFRPIFADIKPMLQDRIHKAQISSQLFGLYKRHQELVEIFKTKYNGGDIPHQKDPRIQVFVDLLSGQGTNPYAPFVLYSLGLDITAFNTQVNLDGLIPVLQNTQTDSRRKSLPPYMHRVFDIFTNICQDSIGYSQLACHVFGNMMEMDIYVIVSYSHRTYVDFYYVDFGRKGPV